MILAIGLLLTGFVLLPMYIEHHSGKVALTIGIILRCILVNSFLYGYFIPSITAFTITLLIIVIYGIYVYLAYIGHLDALYQRYTDYLTKFNPESQRAQMLRNRKRTLINQINYMN